MEWDRKAGAVSGFEKNNMAAVLAISWPTSFLEGPDGALPRNPGKRWHLDWNFYFPDVNGQRHVVGCTGFQTGCDRFTNVIQRFLLGLPLRNAPGNCGAFRNDHARLISFERHQQLHVWMIAEEFYGNANT